MILTPRQQEVAGLVARGLTAPEIAHEIGCSPETVNVHIKQAAQRIPGTDRPRKKLRIWFFSLEGGPGAMA